MHSCNPWKAKTGESPRVQGQPGLHREFQSDHWSFSTKGRKWGRKDTA